MRVDHFSKQKELFYELVEEKYEGNRKIEQ